MRHVNQVDPALVTHKARNVHARGLSYQIGFGDNATHVMDDAGQSTKIEVCCGHRMQPDISG